MTKETDCNPVCQYLYGNTYLQQWDRFITPNLTNYRDLYLSAWGRGITLVPFINNCLARGDIVIIILQLLGIESIGIETWYSKSPPEGGAIY